MKEQDAAHSEGKVSLGELLLNAGYEIVERDKELTHLRSELQQETIPPTKYEDSRRLLV